jgi:pyruvate formate lyase activating enzyme
MSKTENRRSQEVQKPDGGFCLEIKGLQKLSVIDYPGKTCAVVFLGGCNFRCPFCQNPELVLAPEKLPNMPQDEFFAFLQERKKWLDGVCITGGEPCIHQDLPEFIKKIKSMDFLVKLDTNGSNPGMLEQLLKEKLLDYIAMDIKAPLDRYDKAAGVKVDRGRILKSIDLIRNSGVDYELRSTILPKLHTDRDIIAIGEWLNGSKRFFMQQFRAEKTIDPEFRKEKSFKPEELERFKEMLRTYFKEVGVRS